MRHLALALTFTFLFSGAAFAAEDLTIISKASGGDKIGTQTQYITSSKMRMTNADESDAMIDFATGNITMIDHKKKQYSVMTKAEMQAMAQQLDAQMKQMEAQMASLPPAIREKMAGGMGGNLMGNVTVTKGTGTRKIAGYNCQNWIISMGEMGKSESCVSTDLEVPVTAIEGQQSFYNVATMSGPMGRMMKQMGEKMKEMKGFPLANTTTMKIMGKSMTTTTEVTEVKKGAVAASVFEIPAGYKKVDSPAAKMLKK